MDEHSGKAEAEKAYSVLLTRGENAEWRTSLDSLHFQNLYLAKGFSLSPQEINEIRKSTIVQLLNSLVQDGVNFISCYAFTERRNSEVWKNIALTPQLSTMVNASQVIGATPGDHGVTTTPIRESFYIPNGESGEVLL
ncbi:unnamed protein product [Clonostachys rosea]|uniref:Uncharacterized protein n=1 Tax=Bionectria ochroleuca TaxID=29856 RepID=A0ABY6US76_BIOOC|nr:unnamed protein product [Clonostachys rosea]